MYIQQVMQERTLVTGSDGRTRTAVKVIPANADTLKAADGKTYHSVGNAVFQVPDAIGAALVGGLFRDVSHVKGGALITTHAGDQEPPSIEGLRSQDELRAEAGFPPLPDGPPVNAAAPIPEPVEAHTPDTPVKKAAAKKTTAKKAAAKK
jgi:hypothetical protein